MQRCAWAQITRPYRGLGAVAPALGAVLAMLLTGCGSSTATETSAASSHGAASAPGAAVAAPHLSRTRLISEVNDVCSAVRAGAPAALRPPFTTKSLSRHANAALAPTSRTAISLQRLSASGDAAALSRLARDYQQLQVSYHTIALAPRAPRAVRTQGMAIEAQEALVTADAQSGGVPACGMLSR